MFFCFFSATQLDRRDFLISRRIGDSQYSTPWIPTPFIYVDQREDMQLELCKQGYYRIILGRDTEPHHPVEKNKFMNCLDESFSYQCTHISKDLLFHLEGLRTAREAWEKLEVLFGKQESFDILTSQNFRGILSFYAKILQ